MIKNLNYSLFFFFSYNLSSMYLQAFLTFLKFFAKEVQNMKNDLSKYLSKLSIVLFAANIKNNIYKTNIVDSPITIPPV